MSLYFVEPMLYLNVDTDRKGEPLERNHGPGFRDQVQGTRHVPVLDTDLQGVVTLGVPAFQAQDVVVHQGFQRQQLTRLSGRVDRALVDVGMFNLLAPFPVGMGADWFVCPNALLEQPIYEVQVAEERCQVQCHSPLELGHRFLFREMLLNDMFVTQKASHQVLFPSIPNI